MTQEKGLTEHHCKFIGVSFKNPNLDNLEDGEREGGAPQDSAGGGEIALVNDASVAAGILNIEVG